MTVFDSFGLSDLCQSLAVTARPTVLGLAAEVDALFDVPVQYKLDPKLQRPGRFELIGGSPFIIVSTLATEAVIAHELLHAQLAGWMFRAPNVAVRVDDRDLRMLERVHAQLANAMEHRMMFPRFKSLGLDEKKFVDLAGARINGVVEQVRKRRDPQNVVLRAYIATLYVDLSAEYAFASDVAKQLVKSLRNDIYQLYRVCEDLKLRVDAAETLDPAGYARGFVECFDVLGIERVSDCETA